MYFVTMSNVQDICIQQDDEIRVKIMGTRVDANDIVSNVARHLSIIYCMY